MSFVEKQNETCVFVKKLKDEIVPVAVSIGSEYVISKVISIVPIVKLDQILPNNKSAQIEGKLCAKVIVQTDEKGFKCVEEIVNFKAMILDEAINLYNTILAEVSVVGISGLSAGSQNINFNVNVCVSPKLLVKSEFTYLTKVNVAESKLNEVKFSDVVIANSQEFNHEIELMQPSNISEILCADSHVRLISVEPEEDVVKLNGEMITNLIYLDNDESAKLKNQFFVQNFSHELLLTNITVNDNIDATVAVCNTEMTLDGELNSAKGTIILNHTLKATICVEKEKTINMVVDAFCPRYNLITEEDNKKFYSNTKFDSFNEKVDGSVFLGDESERIDRVLCVSGQNVVLEHSVIEGQNLNLVGKLMCNIVYALDDENYTVNSIWATIPFNLNLSVNSTDLVEISVAIKEVEARQKRSKEIDVMAELAILTKFRSFENVTFLSELTLGGERVENFAPMSVYFVNNVDSLWNLSKTLCVAGDVIMGQNPKLTFPITSTFPIIVYRQRNMS